MTDNERAELIERQFLLAQEREAGRSSETEPASPVAQPLYEPPVESLNQRHLRELAERDEAWARARRARARAARAAELAATPAPADWTEHVTSAIKAEREFLLAVVGEAIAEIENRAQSKLDDVIRPLLVQMSELKVSNAELKLANAQLREQLINNNSGNGVGSRAGLMSALN